MSSVCRPDRVADRNGDGDGDGDVVGDEDGVGALPKSCSWAQRKRERDLRERREGIGVNMLLAGHAGEQESKRLGLQLAANNQNLLPISLCLD